MRGDVPVIVDRAVLPAVVARLASAGGSALAFAAHFSGDSIRMAPPSLQADA